MERTRVGTTLVRSKDAARASLQRPARAREGRRSVRRRSAWAFPLSLGYASVSYHTVGYGSVAQESNARAEPEGAGHGVDVGIGEAGARKPLGEGIRFDQDHRVEEVRKTEQRRAPTVRAVEHSPGPQHAADFCEQPVLQRRRRDVVEHRERDGSAEPSIW